MTKRDGRNGGYVTAWESLCYGMLILLGYLVVAVGFAAVVLRVVPEWYLVKQVPYEVARWREEDPARYRAGVEAAPWVWRDADSLDLMGYPCRLGLLAAIWPVGVVWVVGWLVSRATIQGLNTKARTRAVLEAELAKARAEIEDLLRGKGADGTQ